MKSFRSIFYNLRLGRCRRFLFSLSLFFSHFTLWFLNKNLFERIRVVSAEKKNSRHSRTSVVIILYCLRNVQQRQQKSQWDTHTLHTLIKKSLINARALQIKMTHSHSMRQRTRAEVLYLIHKLTAVHTLTHAHTHEQQTEPLHFDENGRIREWRYIHNHTLDCDAKWFSQWFLSRLRWNSIWFAYFIALRACVRAFLSDHTLDIYRDAASRCCSIFHSNCTLHFYNGCIVFARFLDAFNHQFK